MYRMTMLLAALGMVLIGAIRVSAQVEVPIQGNGLYHLNNIIPDNASLGCKAVTVTFLSENMVLWMDSKPLPIYTLIPIDRVGQVFLFSSRSEHTKSIGLSFLSVEEHPQEVGLRIRSINPYFSK